MKSFRVSLATTLLAASAAACSLDVGPQVLEWFEAEMTSIPSPPIEFAGNPSSALGIVVIEDGRVFYHLYINNVEGARGATLHIGGDDEDTPAVANLWTSATNEGVTGTGFVIRDARLDSGHLTGASYQQLLDAIRSGNTYIVMTTNAFPDGAFRAQVLPAG